MKRRATSSFFNGRGELQVLFSIDVLSGKFVDIAPMRIVNINDW
jgi:hypothetical protein